MCMPSLPRTGMQIPLDYEYRDLNINNKGTDAQVASSIDRRTGENIVLNDEDHNLLMLKGTGAQSISTNESRDLGNTRGAGIQIASGRKR